MNRRSLFARTIGAVAAAVAAPFLPKVDAGVPFTGPVVLKNWTFRYSDPGKVLYASRVDDPSRWDYPDVPAP
jgi:hypothetical protein